MIQRRRRVLFSLAALAALAGPGTAGDGGAPGEVPRISAEEARRKAEKGEAVLLDVRSKNAYDASHAEGAVSIPLGELEARLGELPKDKLVAAYCT